MKVTLCSIFRDSEDKLDAYFSRIEKLREKVDLRVIVGEGDSTDDTYEKLADGPIDLLVKHDHGGPKFGSVDNRLRWEQIATVVRAVVDKVDDPGTFVWVEGDLMWSTSTMLGLVASAQKVPAVAPMVLALAGDRFYDAWGFRKDGEIFMRYPPYYFPPDYPFVKIDSCGSCFATADFELVRAWDGIWPFQASGQLWLDPQLTLRHP